MPRGNKKSELFIAYIRLSVRIRGTCICATRQRSHLDIDLSTRQPVQSIRFELLLCPEIHYPLFPLDLLSDPEWADDSLHTTRPRNLLQPSPISLALVDIQLVRIPRGNSDKLARCIRGHTAQVFPTSKDVLLLCWLNLGPVRRRDCKQGQRVRFRVGRVTVRGNEQHWTVRCEGIKQDELGCGEQRGVVLVAGRKDRMAVHGRCRRVGQVVNLDLVSKFS